MSSKIASGRKLRIAWICHFSNEMVRGTLALEKSDGYGDFAPWITNVIEGMKKRSDIELHVISPHKGLIHNTQSFAKDGINYHFYRPFSGFMAKRSGLKAVRMFGVLLNKALPINKWFFFPINSLHVVLFVHRIKPDLVNLMGAENVYFTTSSLWVKRLFKIPILVTIQGIYSNPMRFNEFQKALPLHIKLERRIHREMSYFGIFPQFFAGLIKRDNTNAVLMFQHFLADLSTEIPKESEKKFDFAYFGRVADVKGVDKIIEAVHIMNKRGINTTLIVIGAPEHTYQKHLEDCVRKWGLEKQVTFTGRLSTLKEVHATARKAKVSVISSRFDNLPGTVVESVLMGQPVCATSVGAIPYLNKKGETILLSEFGDVEALADNMLRLLNDPEFAKQLTDKCRNFILTEFEEGAVVEKWIKQYHAVIRHYWKNEPIPRDLLHEYNYNTPNK